VRPEISLVCDKLDRRVLGRELLRYLDAVIGRGIVDYQNTQVCNRLPQNAFDAIAQKMSVLVAGDRDIDTRWGCAVFSGCRVLKVLCRHLGRPRQMRHLWQIKTVKQAA
jgi:hypothetical protein